MYININEIAPEGLTFDEPLELGRIEGLDSAAITVAGARMRGRVSPGSRGAELEAHLDARLGLCCSRCLDTFDTDLSADFNLTIVPDAVEYAVGETRLEEEDASLFVAPEGKADCRVMAVEQIYLNLPLKPVCRPDCAGLCPSCGTNRNRLECDCDLATPDPRLAPLERLRRRGDSS